MPPIRAVIFDLDGCLVDSEPLVLEAIASEMRAIGIADATGQEIASKFLGVAMPVIIDYVSARLGAAVPDDFADRVETQLFATYETELRQIPGAVELLADLHAKGIAMAIATGGSLDRMKTTLQAAGLRDWFGSAATSAAEVAKGKPAPDLFHLAMERLSMTPADCVVLEDSPHGVKGAIAAGMGAYGFVGGSHLEGRREAHGKVLLEAGASRVFDRLSEFGRFVVSQGGKPAE